MGSRLVDLPQKKWIDSVNNCLFVCTSAELALFCPTEFVLEGGVVDGRFVPDTGGRRR